mmetsp:Transcript_36515/g.112501  ORF Transcript_36515/g.112501 Transcript_36515/m.112501 type:complete len:201 (-) Transcript_36515:262-864(-)
MRRCARGCRRLPWRCRGPTSLSSLLFLFLRGGGARRVLFALSEEGVVDRPLVLRRLGGGGLAAGLVVAGGELLADEALLLQRHGEGERLEQLRVLYLGLLAPHVGRAQRRLDRHLEQEALLLVHLVVAAVAVGLGRAAGAVDDAGVLVHRLELKLVVVPLHHGAEGNEVLHRQQVLGDELGELDAAAALNRRDEGLVVDA